MSASKSNDDVSIFSSLSISSSSLSPENMITYNDTLNNVVNLSNRIFDATTSIGLRPSQEDRFCLIPEFYNSTTSFCGIFDGTVGDDASEYINKHIVSHLCNTDEMKDLDNGIFSSKLANNLDEKAELVKRALRKAFLESDAALIAMCAEKKLHYASSTGVTAFLTGNLLTVAHIGDSKACICKVVGDNIQPEWLTVDHKPNMPNEKKRIEQNGGSLAWLHGNKPYIRGGDFFKRQQLGEHPKQLNYSRAFGGKDLKMFGLSAEPDISHFEITSDDKVILLGSDGLWDVINPRTVCEIALQARREGKSATKKIVQIAIEEMPNCGVRDNITVIAIFL